MIPAGVTKLIWAVAPNAIVREAMLGDFNEEFAARERDQGIAAARRNILAAAKTWPQEQV